MSVYNSHNPIETFEIVTGIIVQPQQQGPTGCQMSLPKNFIPGQRRASSVVHNNGIGKSGHEVQFGGQCQGLGYSVGHGHGKNGGQGYSEGLGHGHGGGFGGGGGGGHGHIEEHGLREMGGSNNNNKVKNVIIIDGGVRKQRKGGDFDQFALVSRTVDKDGQNYKNNSSLPNPLATPSKNLYSTCPTDDKENTNTNVNTHTTPIEKARVPLDQLVNLLPESPRRAKPLIENYFVGEKASLVLSKLPKSSSLPLQPKVSCLPNIQTLPQMSKLSDRRVGMKLKKPPAECEDGRGRIKIRKVSGGEVTRPSPNQRNALIYHF